MVMMASWKLKNIKAPKTMSSMNITIAFRHRQSKVLSAGMGTGVVDEAGVADTVGGYVQLYLASLSCVPLFCSFFTPMIFSLVLSSPLSDSFPLFCPPSGSPFVTISFPLVYSLSSSILPTSFSLPMIVYVLQNLGSWYQQSLLHTSTCRTVKTRPLNSARPNTHESRGDKEAALS